MVAVASLYGNARADLKSGNDYLRDASREVVSFVPYMAGETVEDERARAVREYRRLMEKFGRMASGESITGGDR